MDDAAAFKATFAGLRSLTDGDYRISFDFKGEDLTHVVQVLAHGGKPSAAKGTWFAIARLQSEGAALTERNLTIGTNNHTSEHGAARSQRAALLSNKIYLEICDKPVGRKFLEETCQDICRGRPVNDAETAKKITRYRLGVASLSEVDSDPTASAQAEELLRWFTGWQRGLDVKTPRIQQANEA